MRQPFRRALVACLAIIAISLVPQPTSAKPGADTPLSEPSRLGLPSVFGSWRELFEAQRPLDDAATRIEETAFANPMSGFASLTVDAATRSLTVYWRGKPSAAEQALLDAVRGPQVQVTVVPAKYSKLELDAQVALIKQDVTSEGPEQVTHITKRTDGSGIEVGVASDEAAVDATGVSRAPLGSRLPHLQAARAAVDISIVRGSNAGSPALTREADLPRFWGGAVVRHGNNFCSSGFAVHWPRNGADYMTTAAHCGGVGQTYTNGIGTTNMGPGTPGNSGYDLMFIQTPAGSGTRIYTGPRANQPNQGSMPVRRASHTHVGDQLCTGGAATGWHCFIRASGPTQDCRAWVREVGLGNCFHVEGGISTIEDQLIAGQGDSGGPVWTPINGFDRPDSAADARGLISSRPDGWRAEPCGNHPISGTAITCSTAVWFTDIVSAIQPWVAQGGMYVKAE